MACLTPKTCPSPYALPLRSLVILRQRRLGYPQNGVCPLGRGHAWSLTNPSLPNVSYRAKSDCRWSTGISVHLPEKLGSALPAFSRSLKVIGSDTDRLGTYDYQQCHNLSRLRHSNFLETDDWFVVKNYWSSVSCMTPHRVCWFKRCLKHILCCHFNERSVWKCCITEHHWFYQGNPFL